MTLGIAVNNAADALDANRSRLAGRWWVLGLISLVLLVFGPSCRFEFTTWDDDSLITGNPAVNSGSWQGMVDAWKRPHIQMFIPMVYNLWALLAKLSKMIHPAAAPLDPHLFHAANVLVHALNALLVFYLIRRTLKLPWPAVFAGAAVFAIHPLQMEAVCWTTAMKDLLSSCLALLAIHCYCSAGDAWQYPTPADAHHGLNSAAKGHSAYSAGLLFFFMASLAKPGVVALPLIMGTLDVIRRTCNLRQTLIRLIPFAVVGVGATIWTGLAQPYSGTAPLPLALRPALAAFTLAFYLWKVIIPSAFAADYGLTPWRVFAQGYLLWAWIAPFGLFTCIALIRFRFRREMIGASLIFVTGLLPVLGLFPFIFQNYSTVADRYAYLSMAGIGWTTAVLVAIAPSRTHISLVTILLGLASLTLWQSRVWRTSADLYPHIIRVNPDSSMAHNNLGCYLLPGLAKADFASLKTQPLPELERSCLDNIDWLCTRAFTLDCRNPLPLHNQAKAWWFAGRTRPALKLAELITRLHPETIWPMRLYVSIGRGYAQIGEDDTASKYLLLHLSKFPCDNEALGVLAEVSLRHAPATMPSSR